MKDTPLKPHATYLTSTFFCCWKEKNRWKKCRKFSTSTY